MGEWANELYSPIRPFIPPLHPLEPPVVTISELGWTAEEPAVGEEEKGGQAAVDPFEPEAAHDCLEQGDREGYQVNRTDPAFRRSGGEAVGVTEGEEVPPAFRQEQIGAQDQGAAGLLDLPKGLARDTGLFADPARDRAVICDREPPR